MAYRARHLDRKAERLGHRRGPAPIRGRPVRTIEGRVDLDAVEHGGVAFQLAAARIESRGVSGGNRPAGATHMAPRHGTATRLADGGRFSFTGRGSTRHGSAPRFGRASVSMSMWGRRE